MKTILTTALLLVATLCFSQKPGFSEITRLNKGKTVYDLDVSKGRSMLAYGVGNRVIILNVDKNNDSTGVTVPDKVTSIDISEDSSKVAFGTMGGIVGIIDIKTKTLESVFKPHTNVVTSSRLINGNKGVVSSSYDYSLCYTNIESKTTTTIQKFKKEINSIAVQDSIKQFVTLGGDGMLNIWDSQTLKSIGSIKVDKHWGRDVVFRTPKSVVTCGDAGTIRDINISLLSMPYEKEKEDHLFSRIYSVDIFESKYGNVQTYVDYKGKLRIKYNLAFNETAYSYSINDLPYKVRFIGNSDMLVVAIATQRNGLLIIPVSELK